MDDSEGFYIKLGQRIREERTRSGLTQHELAAKVALTRTSVTNIELGRQKLLVHTLVEIANVLEIAPSNLLPTESAQDSQNSSNQARNSILENRPVDEQEWIKAALAAIEEES